MNIRILGGGSFGTALANELAQNPTNKITLLLRNQKTVDEINEQGVNSAYFAKKVLPSTIRATMDVKELQDSDILFWAIPTRGIPNMAEKIKPYCSSQTIMVNLAKGLLKDGQLITDYLQDQFPENPVLSMKGPSFSAEMINNSPTMFTVGFQMKKDLEYLQESTKQTNIFLDHTTDIRGVELLSALKNIYAIALGNVDAHYNAQNTRFLVLTKAIEEIKIMLMGLGGHMETIFLSCGIGDTSLTGLSDLSRNRTLGLLIGKGFYDQNMARNSVVLEGLNTLKVVQDLLPQRLMEKLPLLHRVKELLDHPERAKARVDFSGLFKQKFTTVLTYGTFDLLHYGHLELLRRIKQYGDRIIVGLSTDEFNEIKGKKCVMPYAKRKALLESLNYVDLVIPEDNWEQKEEDVKAHEVDVFMMGADWEGKFDFLEKHCEVIYLPRTKGISTTKLKAILNKKD